MNPYHWTPAERFKNRTADLRALQRWWDAPTRDALALIGRRRVGKSWLFRNFANGKPALILIGEQEVVPSQLERFAERLEPALGVRPRILDLPDLFRLLYRLGHKERYLAVIDEFPYLLPAGKAGQAMLARLQAVIDEERDRSQTKLILCGSHIGQMESLLAARSPLHGRLQRLDVLPLNFLEATPFLDGPETAEDRITRFAITGGMAHYLTELGAGQDLRQLVTERVLDRRGPLFHDPRSVLTQELREPTAPFSILAALARRPAELSHLTGLLQMRAQQLTPYLDTLRRLRVLASGPPIGAGQGSRKHRYWIEDGFMRFWFRFAFPHHDALQADLTAEDVWRTTVEPQLADFVAPAFERLCATYVRRVSEEPLTEAGGWWGKAVGVLRREGSRTTEEIDLVGALRDRALYVGECKWTKGPMKPETLADLLRFKIPALAEEGRLRIPKGGPVIVLFSRGGFDPAIVSESGANPRLRLVEPPELVQTLTSAGDPR